MNSNILSNNNVGVKDFGAAAQKKMELLSSLFAVSNQHSSFMDALAQECKNAEARNKFNSPSSATTSSYQQAKDIDASREHEAYKSNAIRDEKSHNSEKLDEYREQDSSRHIAEDKTPSTTHESTSSQAQEKTEKAGHRTQEDNTAATEHAAIATQAEIKNAANQKQETANSKNDKTTEKLQKETGNNGKEAVLLKPGHDANSAKESSKNSKAHKKNASAKIEGAGQEKHAKTQEQSQENSAQAAQDTANQAKVAVLAGSLTKTANAAKTAAADLDEKTDSRAQKSQKNGSHVQQSQAEQTQQNTNAKASLKTAQQRVTALANDRGETELASRLEKETGVTVKKLSLEGSPVENTGKADSSKGLLNSLLPHARINPAIEKHAADPREQQNNNEQKLDKGKTKEAVQSLGAKTLSTQNQKDAVQEQRANMQNSPLMELGGDKFSQWGAVRNGVAQQTQGSQAAQNAQVIQELLAKMQPMLRGAGLEGGNRLSMEFQTQSLGQFQLSLQQKGDILMVSLQAQTDSSRDQLMQQRDELSRQLQNFGFKNVSLDISSGTTTNGEQQAARNQNPDGWRFQGNDLAENVKLSGSDEADLSQILNM